MRNTFILHHVENQLHAKWIGTRVPEDKPKIDRALHGYRYYQGANAPILLTGAIQCTIFIKDARRTVPQPDLQAYYDLPDTLKQYVESGYFLEVQWLRLACVLAQVARILDNRSSLYDVFPDLLTLLYVDGPAPVSKRWPKSLRVEADRDMKNEIKHANRILAELLLIPDTPDIEKRGNTWNIFTPAQELPR